MNLFNFRNGNWGLKLVALVLAVVIYCAIKNGSADGGRMNDAKIFQQR